MTRNNARRRRRGSAALYLVIALLASGLVLSLDQSGRFLPVKSALNVVLAPLEGALNAPLAGIRGAWDSVAEIGRLRQDNAKLRSQVSALHAEVANLTERARLQLEEAALLSWKQANPNHATKVARVIASDASGISGTMTIDLGTSQGVKVGMSVVSGGGLVGRVIEAFPSSARVLCITSADSRVNLRLQPKDLTAAGLLGTAQGTGQASLIVQVTPTDPRQVIAPGTLAVTSGLGATYPAGLYIGEVTAVERHDYDIFETVLVQPATDMNTLDLVLVITDFQAAITPPR